MANTNNSVAAAVAQVTYNFIINKWLYSSFSHMFKMSSNIKSWLVQNIITVGCVTLVMNSMQTKKVNKSLVETIDRARSYMGMAMNISKECSKQWDMKSADMKAKDKQVASLTFNMNTLMNEKNQIQQQLYLLQIQLDQVNGDLQMT